jgi:hypothetical protein
MDQNASDLRAMTVSHERTPHKIQMCRFTMALAIKPGIRVGGGGVNFVLAPLATEIPSPFVAASSSMLNHLNHKIDNEGRVLQQRAVSRF